MYREALAALAGGAPAERIIQAASALGSMLAEDGQWAAAAAHATAELAAPVTFVQAGTDATPVEAAAFLTGYGLQPDGAALVRPDGYIAWRAVTAPADPARALVTALAEVSAAPDRAARA